jgi:hypothetical protein
MLRCARTLGRRMKFRVCILIVSLLAAASTRAGTTAYANCGTYSSYVLLYRSVDQLEEMGKLRCGEKVEVITRWVEYFQVRTVDGRVGWVHYSEISNTPPATPGSANFGLTDPSAKPQNAFPVLTNASILKMHGMRLGADVIVAKIQSSPCEFDTTPGTLVKLKQAGISDKIILAMVQAPSASAPPPAAKVPEIVEVKIPNGTPIEVELGINVSSDAAQEGMMVRMTVVQDVVINGVTAFQRGSEAQARVATIKQPGFMNRPPGEISWTMEYVTAVTGERIPVIFYTKEASANPLSSFMGAAGPSWEFRKGKPAVVTAGQRFQTVVHGNAVLKVSAAAAANLAAGGTQGQSTVPAAGQPGAAATTPQNLPPAVQPLPQTGPQPKP